MNVLFIAHNCTTIARSKPRHATFKGYKFGGFKTTLIQACKVINYYAHNAFRVLLIHRILQFTVLIALCCVLHRFTSRGIHR